MEKNSIVFYSTNLSKKPWDENASAPARNSLIANVLGLLLEVDGDYNIVSKYLDKYDWDYGNKQYILKLKPNLYFQNGRAVTSKDLEFSLLRPFFAKKNNEGSMFLVNIKGSENKHGQAYHSGLVSGVKIIDDLTISVIPDSPNPTFLYTIARSNYSLVPKEEFEEDFTHWKKWPLGAGKYKIVDADFEKGIFTLEHVNKTDLDGPSKVYFETQRIYEPDFTIHDSELAKKKNYAVQKLHGYTIKRILTFNFNSKLGNNIDFRKAVELALDKTLISDATLLKSEPLDETIVPNNMGRIGVVSSQNIKQAKELFQKVLGNDITKTFKIPASIDPHFGDKYRNILKNQLENAGLHVEFVFTPNLWNAFSEAEFIESPFFLKSRVTDFYDQLLSFAAFRTTSPAVQEHPKDKNFDLLFSEAQTAPSTDILNEKLKELSSYIYENKIDVPLFCVPAVVFYNKDKIENLGEQYGGITISFSNLKKVK